MGRRVYAIPLIIATLIMAVVASGCTGVGKASTPTLPLTVKYTQTLHYCNYHSSLYYEKNISIPIYTAGKNITVESYNVTVYLKKCHNVTVFKKSKIYIISYPLYALKNDYPPKDEYSLSAFSPKKDLTPVARVYYIVNPKEYDLDSLYYSFIIFNVSALMKYNITAVYLPNGKYIDFYGRTGLQKYKKRGVNFIIFTNVESVTDSVWEDTIGMELEGPYKAIIGNAGEQKLVDYSDVLWKYIDKTKLLVENAVTGGYTAVYYKGKDITDWNGIYKLDDGTTVAIFVI